MDISPVRGTADIDLSNEQSYDWHNMEGVRILRKDPYPQILDVYTDKQTFGQVQIQSN